MSWPNSRQAYWRSRLAHMLDGRVSVWRPYGPTEFDPATGLTSQPVVGVAVGVAATIRPAGTRGGTVTPEGWGADSAAHAHLPVEVPARAGDVLSIVETTTPALVDTLWEIRETQADTFAVRVLAAVQPYTQPIHVVVP